MNWRYSDTMLSSQLASILDGYARREGRFEALMGDNECLLVSRDGSFTVTIASVPDPETVMLYGEVGRWPNGGESSEPEWIVADPEETEDSESDGVDPLGHEPTVAFDTASRALVLTDSAQAALLDPVTFDRWLDRFLEELALTAEVFREVAADAPAESPVPGLHEFILRP